jgi:putative hemolysin
MEAVLLVALLAIVFVLGAAEAALLHVRRSAVIVEANRGDPRAAQLLRLLDDLPTVMNAVLLAVLLVQLTAATVAGVLARRWFGGIGLTVATIVLTAVLFVYGEAIPKTLAVRRPLRVARWATTPVRWLSVVLRPVVSGLVRLADAQLPGEVGQGASSITEDELRHLADEAASAGQIELSEAELIARSFALGDTHVAQLLVPRVDIVAVEGGTPVRDALDTAVGAGHRRLPVYERDIDEITGFVRLRDLARVVTTDPAGPVRAHAREVLAVPESRRVLDLLREMQGSGVHLAVVVDEYGGTAGIVTIEDVVEELVGSIEEPT